MQEAEIERRQFQASLGKKKFMRPHLNNNNKRLGMMVFA
jgi:hypothetical protein